MNNANVNEMNSCGYSVKPEDVAPENVVALSESAFELFNVDGTSNDQVSAMQLGSEVSDPRNMPNTPPLSFNFGLRLGPTDHQLPELHSSVLLSRGKSSETLPSNEVTCDYVKYPHSAPPVQTQVAAEFPVCSDAVSRGNSGTIISNSSGSEFSVLQNQNVGFSPSLWTENRSTSPHEYRQLEKENSTHEGTEISHTTSLSRRAHEQEVAGKHLFESNCSKSGSLINNPHNHSSTEANITMGTPSLLTTDMGSACQSLNQNHSPYSPMLSTRINEISGIQNFSPKYTNVNNDHLIANARNLLLSALPSKDRTRSYLSDASQFSVLCSEKSSSMPRNQNYAQQMDIFRKNSRTSMNDFANLAYQSHISSQTPSSWLKHYEALKNRHILPLSEASAAQQMGCRNLQESSLILQVDSASTDQGGGLCRSTAATSVASNKLTTACVFPSFQNMALSIPKKRKFAELDMVPWHEEVNLGQTSLQDISTAECIWAQALNRKPEEASNAVVNAEKLLHVIRAEKRLICTTQLMQQIFRPTPVIILRSHASLSSDSVAYVAARLEFGEAWCLIGQLESDTGNMSLDKPTASKKTKACRIVEAFTDRIKQVEADLSRVDKSLSFVHFNVEAGEMEKFSTNNRFARFHSLRALPVIAGNTSSSHMTALTNPWVQKYVIPRAMPEIVPDVQGCLSL